MNKLVIKVIIVIAVIVVCGLPFLAFA